MTDTTYLYNEDHRHLHAHSSGTSTHRMLGNHRLSISIEERDKLHTCFQFRPVPNGNERESGSERKVIAKLGDRVCRGVSRQANGVQRFLVNPVIGINDGRLVVRLSIRAEKRRRHERNVPSIENVGIICSGKDDISDTHSDERVDCCGGR